MTSPAIDPKGRIPELDGIRGIAIAMVLVAHLFQVVSAPVLPSPTPSFLFA